MCRAYNLILFASLDFGARNSESDSETFLLIRQIEHMKGIFGTD
jgi:hypothetical protein